MTTPALDWREFALGELLSFSNGINADKSAYGAGVPFANVLEVITNESIAEADIPGRIAIDPKVQRRFEVKPGDVLFNRTSETQEEVGLASVYVGNEPIVFGGFVFRGRPLTDELSPTYSKYAFRSPLVRKQIVARGQGGIRANIGQRDLKAVAVRLPSRREQSAIAETLDDVSCLIAALKRMIAKKQAIKQGVMEELLTGKTRFPGFTAPWREITMGDLASVTGGGTPSTRIPSLWGGGIPWFTPAEIPESGAGVVTASDRTITVAGLQKSAAKLLPEGTVLVTSRASIGNCAIAGCPVATNQGFTSLVPKDRRSTEFLYYWVQQHRASFVSRAAGSTFLEISGSKVAAIEILAPDANEQGAIGTVLADSDAELRALQQRLTKARDVKQGMMQELLTGRTRLPLEAAS